MHVVNLLEMDNWMTLRGHEGAIHSTSSVSCIDLITQIRQPPKKFAD